MKEKVDAIEHKLANNESSFYFKKLNDFFGTEVPKEYLDEIINKFE